MLSCEHVLYLMTVTEAFSESFSLQMTSLFLVVCMCVFVHFAQKRTQQALRSFHLIHFASNLLLGIRILRSRRNAFDPIRVSSTFLIATTMGHMLKYHNFVFDGTDKERTDGERNEKMVSEGRRCEVVIMQFQFSLVHTFIIWNDIWIFIIVNFIQISNTKW